MMISTLTHTGVWCHPSVSHCLRMSFVTDTGLWLLVLGLIREGHPGTVMSWVFFVHCLKRATVTEGSFYSSDFNSNFSTQVSSHSSYSTWFTNFSTQAFFFVVIFFMMALFLGRVEVSCSNESGGGDEVPSPISIFKLLHIYMSLSKE
jgi:hypothetical protein